MPVACTVDGLEGGTHITAAELTLPQGSKLVSDPETLVIAINAPQAADLGETAEETTEETAEEPAADADTAADNG